MQAQGYVNVDDIVPYVTPTSRQNLTLGLSLQGGLYALLCVGHMLPSVKLAEQCSP